MPAIGQAISFGVANNTEAIGDTALGFEISRSAVILTGYDFVNDKLIFKAPIPDEISGIIYEVALWSQVADTNAGVYGSRLLTSFDSDTEEWVGGTFQAVNTRIGVDSLRHAPALSTSMTSTYSDIFLDLSGNSGIDNFMVAYNIGNAFTANIKIRFKTDAANYYELTITAPSVGYKVTSIAKNLATVTGVPSWENITQIEVITTSTSGGSAQVDLDGVRIEDTDTINTDYVMVSRELLTTPYEKTLGKVQDIEYSLVVTV